MPVLPVHPSTKQFTPSWQQMDHSAQCICSATHQAFLHCEKGRGALCKSQPVNHREKKPSPPNVKLIIVTMTFDNLWICICSQSRVSINHFHMIVKAVSAMHRTASSLASLSCISTWCNLIYNLWAHKHTTNTHTNTYNTHIHKLMQHTGLHSRTYPNKQALMLKITWWQMVLDSHTIN